MPHRHLQPFQPRRALACLAIAAAGVLLSGAAGAVAEDFTFHMVKPPQAGTKHFITVQIDPAEQAKRLAPPAPLPSLPKTPNPADTPVVAGAGSGLPANAGKAQYSWFWNAISPALGYNAGRFSRALAALALGPNGQAVKAPRLADMQAIAKKYGRDILSATIGTRVSPALVLAVIGVESDGNPKVTSHRGAKGLMQLMPATAKRFAVSNVFNADQNIKGGVAYLDWLMHKFNGDPLMVLAAYNAGEKSVADARGVPAIAETRDYVPKVLAAWTVAQGLCLTPPELVSDGCVFRTIAAN